MTPIYMILDNEKFEKYPAADGGNTCIGCHFYHGSKGCYATGIPVLIDDSEYQTHGAVYHSKYCDSSIWKKVESPEGVVVTAPTTYTLEQIGVAHDVWISVGAISAGKFVDYLSNMYDPDYAKFLELKAKFEPTR